VNPRPSLDVLANGKVLSIPEIETRFFIPYLVILVTFEQKLCLCAEVIESGVSRQTYTEMHCETVQFSSFVGHELS
jgi:hypothetical protein